MVTKVYTPDTGTQTINHLKRSGSTINITTTGKELTPITCDSVANTTITFEDADVHVVNNTVTETAHGLVTGDRVTISNSGGALPAGLSATTYYIIRTDDNTLKFATTLANADAGTAVDITAAAGGGTHTINAQGHIRLYSGSDARNYVIIPNKGGIPLMRDIAGAIRISVDISSLTTVFQVVLAIKDACEAHGLFSQDFTISLAGGVITFTAKENGNATNGTVKGMGGAWAIGSIASSASTALTLNLLGYSVGDYISLVVTSKHASDTFSIKCNAVELKKVSQNGEAAITFVANSVNTSHVNIIDPTSGSFSGLIHYV